MEFGSCRPTSALWRQCFVAIGSSWGEKDFSLAYFSPFLHLFRAPNGLVLESHSSVGYSHALSHIFSHLLTGCICCLGCLFLLNSLGWRSCIPPSSHFTSKSCGLPLKQESPNLALVILVPGINRRGELVMAALSSISFYNLLLHSIFVVIFQIFSSPSLSPLTSIFRIILVSRIRML